MNENFMLIFVGDDSDIVTDNFSFEIEHRVRRQIVGDINYISHLRDHNRWRFLFKTFSKDGYSLLSESSFSYSSSMLIFLSSSLSSRTWSLLLTIFFEAEVFSFWFYDFWMLNAPTVSRNSTLFSRLNRAHLLRD